ncbi:TPA: hypothetical protein ACMVTQ_003027 [Clostridioides difficile]|uniref:hypothetical protein n=3 Tax=Clostridioides difficile TaxID=1496 RepID=UPI00038DA35E|nr:hypothetical protein [Clostridioides difficile]EAA0010527.1 hypothetical protein [Clostridioides difficile]EGT3661369.1 hypothetical protein [Clostridioides difficile]EGT3779676.1 hypothetical protein [Clostridioides difficile]EGT3820397.1 hypothetical protein [Clostridioides difficile]EGT3856593.1 hypothetical protein [Clostridioides difficile]
MTEKLTDNASLRELMIAFESAKNDLQIDKNNIASTLGSPFLGTDKLDTTKTKTQTLKNTLASNITNKGIVTNSTESLQDMISKVSSIKDLRQASGTASAFKGRFYDDYYYLWSVNLPQLNFVPLVVFVYADYRRLSIWVKSPFSKYIFYGKKDNVKTELKDFYIKELDDGISTETVIHLYGASGDTYEVQWLAIGQEA